VLTEVNAIEVAIGYADSSAIGGYPRARPITIDGVQGSSQFLTGGYQFWTIEYAYRRADDTGSFAEDFLHYMQGDSVARRMREEGYIPCLRSDGVLESLCQPNSR
jgi:hypothetical protein